jgi:hypothetical protein
MLGFVQSPARPIYSTSLREEEKHVGAVLILTVFTSQGATTAAGASGSGGQVGLMMWFLGWEMGSPQSRTRVRPGGIF